MSTIGEQKAQNERQTERQERLAQRETWERDVQRTKTKIAALVISSIVAAAVVSLGLLWVVVKVVRLAWGSP